MNWGAKITLSMLAFMAFILTLVIWGLNEDFYLVEQNYYQQEIEYQTRIDKITNANLLSREIEIHLDREGEKINLLFPAEFKDQSLSGLIHLFRPSNEALDRKIPFNIEGESHFSTGTKNLRPGLWKIKLDWSDTEKDYYYEQVFVW